MNPDVERLREIIELKYRCRAEHVESTPVAGSSSGGLRVVETFELVGHPETRRCFAWSRVDGAAREWVTVLEVPPIDSPRSALLLSKHSKGIPRH